MASHQPKRAHPVNRFQRIAIYLTALLVIFSGFIAWAALAHADPSTNVTVTQVDGFYGRRYIATVDGPVNLVIWPATNIATGAGCVSVYGEAGPHQSGYPIGATCTAPGTVIVDTIVYPACDDHLVIVADNATVVFDQLIGSGNCTPTTTTTSSTVPPTTTTSTTVAGRHCEAWRYGKGGGKTCIRWSTP